VKGLTLEEKSECPTLQKQFHSRINPIKSKRQAQKKEGYTWLACYNDLVCPQNLATMIQAMPKDLRNMPAESLHLHIKDFELTFATNTRPS
jgi:hypothetical protein